MASRGGPARTCNVRDCDRRNCPEQPPQDHQPYGLSPILSVEEAAHFLGLNAKTVYGAIAAQRMPGRKVGQRTVILRDALLDWLRSQDRVVHQRKRKKR